MASLPFDRRLYKYDVQGSIAHTRMLAKQGTIPEKEAELIVTGLSSIREELDKGIFPFRPEHEDIHMNIEARLHEKIGAVAGKLHTGRSRNDQVALDMRLFLREAIGDTVQGIKALQKALLDLAEKNGGVALPGYTHLQRAQPLLLAHHLLAYFEMLQRDRGRFADGLKRAEVLPLGSGALAGVPYPVDREFLARELGFREISRNSLDAVSDRDFVLEYQAAAAIAMVHLSRMAEELVIWSSAEFGFVEVGEEYATGSSIMPQKRNPDAAELVRGKAGRVFGHLTGFLATMKALPLSYNRDMQEDKEALFDTVDTLNSCLETMAGMLGGLRIKKERMEQAAREGYILATDLADYLVKKGMPFREAHRTLKELVAYAIKKKKGLGELDLQEYHSFSPLFEKDVLTITLESSLQARRAPGGTAPDTVERALKEARKGLEAES
ncbi:MAG TPA: argininosuccinate lyase [Dehalococcoidia bacterium]|nr:argininosuccinate lyase [Dehalococcoidia bacterium]